MNTDKNLLKKEGEKDMLHQNQSQNVTNPADALETKSQPQPQQPLQPQPESDYLNELTHLKADFENMQKILEKEKRESMEYANENLIKELLCVLDSFEKAVGAEVFVKEFVKEKEIKEKPKNKSLEEMAGIKNLYHLFYQILKKNGLKRIEAVGKKFDPYYHEVLVREKSKQEEGIILEELQAGYMLKSKVIRPSKVKISGGK